MSTEAMLAKAYQSYRAHLEVMLHIPSCATDDDIHARIAAGLPTSSLDSFCEHFSPDLLDRAGFAALSTNQMQPALTQLLSENDGAYLVRITQIVALADVFFGDEAKARRWLSTPKKRFSGETPIAMLSTSQGMWRVEQLIIQAAEGITF
ncbi:antitoxin Xre/MbcA/ParS toxin-binding domain-containing protein [Pseudomonas sp. SDO55104_S430]